MLCFLTVGQSIACAFGHPRSKHTLSHPCPTQGAKLWGEPGPRCHLQPTQLLASIEIEPELNS